MCSFVFGKSDLFTLLTKLLKSLRLNLQILILKELTKLLLKSSLLIKSNLYSVSIFLWGLGDGRLKIDKNKADIHLI